MRLLLVVPPFVGHVSPMLAVSRRLVERGHTVAWAADPEFLARILPADAIVYPCALPWNDDPPERDAGLRGPAALKFLWEDVLVPLAEASAPGIDAAIDAFAPDAVVTDQQAFAGALIAERRDVPWIVSATTSGEFTDPLSGLPLVTAWIDAQLAALRERLGVATVVDPRFSPLLTIACADRELCGPAADDERFGPVTFVGPVLRSDVSSPDDDALLSWFADGVGPRVVVALGTANAEVGGAFLRVAVAAIATLGVRAVIADPLGDLLVPDHLRDRIRTAARIPQQALLEHADAFVSHCGHNSANEALWRDVPILAVPIRDDQPVVAQHIAEAGAAVREKFSRVTAPRLASALRSLLSDPDARSAAARIGARLRASPGAEGAAVAIETAVAGVREG